MLNLQNIKEAIKYFSRKYLNYDPGLRKVRIGDDFRDQKGVLSDANVEVIFDVGANVGQTTQKYRKLFPKADIYGFEPFRPVFEIYLNTCKGDRRIHPENIALSNRTGDAEFFVNSLHYTNSLLRNNTEYTNDLQSYAPIATIHVKTATLDSYCATHAVERIHILKMDVQGGELLVLEGALELLTSARINLIYAEVEFVPIYQRQPLLKDLESFLVQYHYRLHKMYNVYKSNDNQPMAADVIFVHDGIKGK